MNSLRRKSPGDPSGALDPDAAPARSDAPGGIDNRRAPVIERNGCEYLVTVNGEVFVALTLEQAAEIARRRLRRCS